MTTQRCTPTSAQRYSVECWNCGGDGLIEPADEWSDETCSVCLGKGFLVVSELTDDNCETAIPIKDTTP
jgi:DnaJ-class molecular chaperone